MEAIGWIAVLVVDPLREKVRYNIHFGLDTSPIALLGILLVFVPAQGIRERELRAELERTV